MPDESAKITFPRAYFDEDLDLAAHIIAYRLQSHVLLIQDVLDSDEIPDRGPAGKRLHALADSLELLSAQLESLAGHLADEFNRLERGQPAAPVQPDQINQPS